MALKITSHDLGSCPLAPSSLNWRVAPKEIDLEKKCCSILGSLFGRSPQYEGAFASLAQSEGAQDRARISKATTVDTDHHDGHRYAGYFP
jgi:hypothetical protein